MAGEDQVRQYLSKLYIHKSTEPDVMQPSAWRELVHVILRPFLIIFEKTW